MVAAFGAVVAEVNVSDLDYCDTAARQALRRHPHDPSQPNHTFYFHIDDGRVIASSCSELVRARWPSSLSDA